MAMCRDEDWGEQQLARLNEPGVAKVIERNVEAISRDRRKAESRRTAQQRVADWVTHFAGTMTFVYLHVGWFAFWISANSMTDFDPGFSKLTMAVSLEAIFLTVFVLISENRQGELADRRAELDLQINLLDEYETTRILKLVTALAEKAGIECIDPELEELQEDVEPEKVLEKVDTNSELKAHEKPLT